MTKKDRRRRVFPRVMVPALPQSTWAASPGAKARLEEGGVARRAYGPHVGCYDAEAAGVALLGPQSLIDLGGAVGVALQPAGDGGLEGVELARTPGAAAAGEGGEVRVFRYRLRADPQFVGDLIETQAAVLMEEAGFAVGS